MQEAATNTPSLTDRLARRPFVAIALLYILGIVAHDHLPNRPGLYLILIAAALLLAIAPLPILRTICLAVALPLAGVAMTHLHTGWYPADDISHHLSDQPRLARLDLRIEQPPRILTGRFSSSSRPLPPRQVTQVRILRIHLNGQWQAASGRMLVQIAEPHPGLAIGQRIDAIGTLGRPMPAANPGQFDWAGYYKEQRILASFHIAHAENVNILESPAPGSLDRLRLSARAALERGFASNRALDHALLRALVLGDGDPQLRDIQDEFMRTGTSHHLAISGMHIAILGAIVFGLCRLVFLSPRLSTWIGLCSVLVYGLVVLPSPPVVRSVLLCSAVAVGLLSRRSLDGIHLLALCVFLMLIYQPLDLYGAGFQLSFGTVLGLMLFVRPTLTFFRSLRDRDVMIAEQFQNRTAFRLAFMQISYFSLETLLTAAVAWIVSAPLIAFHFNQLNPYALLVGVLLAIPVCLALLAGLLKIVLTLLCPWAAGPLASMAAIPVGWMRWGVDQLARIPGSNVPLPAPPIWLIVVYYALLALFLLAGRPQFKPLLVPVIPVLPRPWHAFITTPRIRRWLRLGPVAALALLVTVLFSGRSHATDTARITLLSVGAGQCATIQLPSGQTILIDAGSISMADPARTCLLPCLKHAGAARIDRAVVSHANEDHFNALAQTLAHYGSAEISLSPAFTHHADAIRPADELLDALHRLNCPITTLAAGRQLRLDPETTLDVLWPPPDDNTLDPNNSSLVLKLSLHGQRILFAGDIQRPALDALLLYPESLRADVLIAPHHGSAEPPTEDFLAAVNPSIVLCSNGQRLSRKQHDFDRLCADRTLYRTSRHGALRLDIAPSGALSVHPFLPRK